MTRSVPFLNDINSEFNSVLLDVKDDLSAVVIGFTQAELFMSEYLAERMPNLSKKINPLKPEGFSLSLTVLAKWAYALGFVSRTTYDFCVALGDLRNTAAHLKTGPNFQLTNDPQKSKVDKYFSELWKESEVAKDSIAVYQREGASLQRAKFNGIVAGCTGAISGHHLSYLASLALPKK